MATRRRRCRVGEGRLPYGERWPAVAGPSRSHSISGHSTGCPCRSLGRRRRRRIVGVERERERNEKRERKSSSLSRASSSPPHLLKRRADWAPRPPQGLRLASLRSFFLYSSFLSLSLSLAPRFSSLEYWASPKRDGLDFRW